MGFLNTLFAILFSDILFIALFDILFNIFSDILLRSSNTY